jgi:hypothetical protein
VDARSFYYSIGEGRTKLKDKIIKQLEAALAFVGQAQEVAPNESALWKELGELYEQVDDTITLVKDEYDDEGSLI